MKTFAVVQSISQKKRLLCISAVVILGALVYYMNAQKAIIIINDGDEDELAKASVLLIENNIDAKLSKGGTALAVPKQSLDDARLLLAANVVFAPIYTSELNLTEELDENTRKYLQTRAKEDEIGKSIEAIDGVDKAHVLLSLSEESTITAVQNTASFATVILEASNGLSDEQLIGIANYISKCVTNMKPENVSIASPNGNVMFVDGKVVGSGADGDF